MMNIDIEKKAEELLSLKGFRKTGPRLMILSALLDSDEPLSQEQIAGRMQHQGVNKTTIYRTLSSLVKADIVHEAVVRDRIQYYETACHCKEHMCHPHFQCTLCGKVICLHDLHVPLVKGLKEGFIVQRQKTMIEGIGPECAAAICNP